MGDFVEELANLTIQPDDLSIPHELQSSEQKRLLDTVDALRGYGVGDFAELPQIIVCGIQSSGKSSVLEAISGVPFPRDRSTCTRFATEVSLRRRPATSVTVSITPGPTRQGEERDKLLQFKHILKSYDGFPDLFSQASEAMGLSDPTKKSFSDDRLKVEVTGPKQPQLTLVDLPGLIQTSEGQSGKLVKKLVTDYMKNSKAIILAVVTAETDAENQSVLELAKREEIDAQGQRTLGILTKPDILENMPLKEREWQNIVRNENAKFKFELGWHIVRNVDSGREGSDREERLDARDKIEAEYFAKSNFKEDLSKKLEIGITALRKRLSNVLFEQIKKHLPTLLRDIDIGIKEAESELDKLGKARTSEREQRHYLSGLSKQLTTLCQQAVGGAYSDAFFNIPGSNLCGLILNAHEKFAIHMDDEGKGWEIVEAGEEDVENRRYTKETKLDEIREMIWENRGTEFAGQINPIVIRKLFQKYSRFWEREAKGHLEDQYNVISDFLNDAVSYIADEETRGKLYPWIAEKMQGLFNHAQRELNKILAVYDQYPMTANPNFYKRLQRLQRNKDNRRGARSDNRSNHSASNDDEDLKSNNFLKRVTAEGALDMVETYYEATVHTFIDNTLTLATWAPMVAPLPEIFTSSDVDLMDAAIVRDLAGESENKVTRRAGLESKLHALKKGRSECKQHYIPPRAARGARPSMGTSASNGLHPERRTARSGSSTSPRPASRNGSSSSGPRLTNNRGPSRSPAEQATGSSTSTPGMFDVNANAPNRSQGPSFGFGGFGSNVNGSNPGFAGGNGKVPEFRGFGASSSRESTPFGNAPANRDDFGTVFGFPKRTDTNGSDL